MSKESFSSESTNPRIRRSFAHAKISKAITTGMPEDKLAAVETAIKASANTKGRELGRQALSTFRRSTAKELRPSIPLRRTHSHTEFTSNDTFARAIEAVASIDGKSMGVVVQVERPESKEGYIDAVHRADASRVRNLADIIEFDINGTAKPADIPETEAGIQNVADYHLRNGSHVIDVTSTQDTGNFYQTVRSITQPHGSAQSKQ